MTKKLLTIIFILFNIFVFSQNSINKNLIKLFNNLNVSNDLKTMIQNSELKFEYGENRGVGWTGGNTKTYFAEIKDNELIETQILNGQTSIKQNEYEEKYNMFEINERFVFKNEDDLLFEFNKLYKLFENEAFKIKESETLLNNSLNTISQTKELLFKLNDEISALTIGYYLPNRYKKEYSLIIVYKNKLRK